MCSIISGTVNTFDDVSFDLVEHSMGNLSVLLLADCSTRPRFALFISPKHTVDGREIFTIELHVDDDVVTYAPRADFTDWISVNGQLEVQVITEILPIENKLKYDSCVQSIQFDDCLNSNLICFQGAAKRRRSSDFRNSSSRSNSILPRQYTHRQYTRFDQRQFVRCLCFAVQCWKWK